MQLESLPQIANETGISATLLTAARYRYSDTFPSACDVAEDGCALYSREEVLAWWDSYMQRLRAS